MELAGAGLEFEVVAGEAKEELKQGIEALLVRAQRDGAVRADVTGDVVMGLVGGTCMAAGPGHAEPSALLAIVCDGLRAQSNSG
jgi:hypothetical protein